jgi:hypothetical protein
MKKGRYVSQPYRRGVKLPKPIGRGGEFEALLYLREGENADSGDASHSLRNTSPSAMLEEEATRLSAAAVCSRLSAIMAARTSSVVLSNRPFSMFDMTKSSKSGGKFII